jgi:hypothetical protein
MFKNNAESSLFELLRDVLGKNFQSSMPFVWFPMFISLHQCGITGRIKFRCMASAFYAQIWRMSSEANEPQERHNVFGVMKATAVSVEKE